MAIFKQKNFNSCTYSAHVTLEDMPEVIDEIVNKSALEEETPNSVAYPINKAIDGELSIHELAKCARQAFDLLFNRSVNDLKEMWERSAPEGLYYKDGPWPVLITDKLHLIDDINPLLHQDLDESTLDLNTRRDLMHLIYFCESVVSFMLRAEDKSKMSSVKSMNLD